jgi:flagellar basal body-associated protein FliL
MGDQTKVRELLRKEKEMENLGKNWVILWVLIVFTLCGMLTTGWWFENWKTVQMAKQGYEERTIPGRSSFAWQKVK